MAWLISIVFFWPSNNLHRYRKIIIGRPLMILHGPMPQRSVHNSWKLKMSQFFHGLYTHQTCQPLCMSGMLWINVYECVPVPGQYPETLHSRWRGVIQHSTGHNPPSNQLYAKEMCHTAWGKTNGVHTRYWLAFWSTPLPLRYLWPIPTHYIFTCCIYIFVQC
jgi:hypothetical protein